MMAYFSQAMKSFSRSMAYRAEVWLQIGGNILFLLIQISIWKALLGDSITSGVGLKEMVIYSILNTSLSIILMTHVHNQVDESLKTGGIMMHLVKPLRYPFFLFADEAGKNMYKIVFQLIPTLLIAALLFGLQPISATHDLIPFVATVMIALLISFGIGYLIALVAFWFMTTFALRWTVGGLIKIFSGSFIPLWFFPPVWQDIANMLPFKFLGFVPAAVYLGKMTSNEIYQNIIVGLIWIAILYGLVSLLWWKALRRLAIQGG
ncbi:ABC-2 family transporter protein [Paenibacillus sp. 32O-W]|uniref:ABC transporter permease n=1 Tax=Paenibacillus sp. 32O-W TaxID=1695218 RepID=UPI0011A4A048|nr:ABC-2 family transporter protein [Paenibacillus sp. 32O-W]